MVSPFGKHNRLDLSFYKPLIPCPTPVIDRSHRRGFPRPYSLGHGTCWYSWAISSAVEHFVDIEGVTSSNLVSPTMNSLSRAVRGTPATPGAGPRRDRQETDHEGSQLAPLAEEPAP